MGRLRPRRLSSQIFAFQALILAGTLLVGFLLALYSARNRLDDEYQQRALGVARSVAATPEVARAVAREDRSGVVQRRAERVRRMTGMSFVVVTDRRGIRYSHPEPDRIGERVSTDPSEALDGGTVLAVEEGTLGRSARAKVPLRTADRRIVGIVSVGVLQKTIREELGSAIPVIAGYAALALAVGLAASLLFARRLKRRTFGLELDEIVDLLQEREATLHGIREGVVAVDARGCLRVVNDEAKRLLGWPADAEGRSAAEVAGQGRLADLLFGRLSGSDLVLVHGDRVLVANRMPVRVEGADLGAVVTLRDRTELEELVRELDSVRSLTDAMRAQAHEFSNRLHTLSGLLQLGHHQEAIDFVREITSADTQLRRLLMERIDDPLVAALVLAKSAVATERGVELRLADETELHGELVDARAVLTVLGNLIDNSLDAVRTGAGQPAWTEVLLRTTEDGALYLRVADSGPGVPPERREAIFEAGYTTKDDAGTRARGVGLALVRRLTERRGGSVSVGDAADGGGAVFEVWLPESVRVPAAAAADEADEREGVIP